MRLDDTQIKQAILHPNPEIRVKAMNYFVDSCSDDPSVMPVVIETVEKHGRESALFRTLRRADALAQSPATIDWLINELNLDCDPSDKKWDNYLLSIAMILKNAAPNLIIDRRDEIVSASGFHEKLIPILDERLDLHRAGWRECWDKLAEFCRSHADDETFALATTRTLGELVDALGRKIADDQGARDYCEAQFHILGRGETDWIAELSKVRLAGAMNEASAFPWLLEQLSHFDDGICDESVTALTRIGTAEVVDGIAEIFPGSSETFRNYATDPLSHIHSESVVDVCLRLLKPERNIDVAVSLGHALLAHFDDRAIKPVHALLKQLGGDGFDPEAEDLMYDLLLTSTIMDRTFPEYAELMEFAEGSNWGWGDYEEPRLSDVFFDESQTLEGAVRDIMEAGEHPERFELDEPLFVPPSAERTKIGRNEPCPCGSGKKYKKCCLGKDKVDPLLN